LPNVSGFGALGKIRVELQFGSDRSASGRVAQPQAELLVGLLLVLGVGFAEHGEQIAQCRGHVLELLSGHAGRLLACGFAEFGLGELFLGRDLRHPLRDRGRVPWTWAMLVDMDIALRMADASAEPRPNTLFATR
jgi:hypothetical protein